MFDVMILFRSVFEDDGAYNQQVFLEKRLVWITLILLTNQEIDIFFLQNMKHKILESIRVIKFSEIEVKKEEFYGVKPHVNIWDVDLNNNNLRINSSKEWL